MNQQRRCRQPIAGIVELTIVMRMGRHNVGNELAQSVKHDVPPKRSFLPADGERHVEYMS